MSDSIYTRFSQDILHIFPNKFHPHLAYTLKPLSHAPQDGQTLAHIAIEAGSTEALEAILQLAPGLGSESNTLGDTPAHDAIRHEQQACLAVLLKCGAVRSTPDRAGRSPLHTAAVLGSVPAVEAILAAIPDAATWLTGEGYTAAHVAAATNQGAVLASLAAKVPAMLAQPCAESTAAALPLHAAAHAAAYGALAALIQAGVSVNVADLHGRTALHALASAPAVPALGCIALLLLHGAHAGIVDAHGSTPESLAAAEATQASDALTDAERAVVSKTRQQQQVLPALQLVSQPAVRGAVCASLRAHLLASARKSPKAPGHGTLRVRASEDVDLTSDVVVHPDWTPVAVLAFSSSAEAPRPGGGYESGTYLTVPAVTVPAGVAPTAEWIAAVSWDDSEQSGLARAFASLTPSKSSSVWHEVRFAAPPGSCSARPLLTLHTQACELAGVTALDIPASVASDVAAPHMCVALPKLPDSLASKAQVRLAAVSTCGQSGWSDAVSVATGTVTARAQVSSVTHSPAMSAQATPATPPRAPLTGPAPASASSTRSTGSRAGADAGGELAADVLAAIQSDNLELLRAAAPQERAALRAWASSRHKGRALQHIAAGAGAARVLVWLLTLGAFVDAPDSVGATPLVHAALTNHMWCVALLLGAGASPSGADKRGFTALHYAVQGGHSVIAQLLLEAGADPKAAAADGQSAADKAQASTADGMKRLFSAQQDTGLDPVELKLFGRSRSAVSVLARIGVPPIGLPLPTALAVQHARKFTPFWESADPQSTADWWPQLRASAAAALRYIAARRLASVEDVKQLAQRLRDAHEAGIATLSSLGLTAANVPAAISALAGSWGADVPSGLQPVYTQSSALGLSDGAKYQFRARAEGPNGASAWATLQVSTRPSSDRQPLPAAITGDTPGELQELLAAAWKGEAPSSPAAPCGSAGSAAGLRSVSSCTSALADAASAGASAQELARAQEEIENLRTQLATLQRSQAVTSAQQDVARNEAADAHGQLRQAKTELSLAQAAVESAQSALVEEKAARAEVEAKCQAAIDARSASERAAEGLRERIQQLERELADAHSATKTADGAVTASRAEIESLQEQLSDQKAAVQAEKDARAAAEATASKSQSALESAQPKLKRLAQEVRSLRSQLQEAQSAAGKSAAAAASSAASLAALQDQLDSTNQELAAANDSVTASGLKAGVYQSQVEDAEAALEAEQAAHAATKALIARILDGEPVSIAAQVVDRASAEQASVAAAKETITVMQAPPEQARALVEWVERAAAGQFRNGDSTVELSGVPKAMFEQVVLLVAPHVARLAAAKDDDLDVVVSMNAGASSTVYNLSAQILPREEARTKAAAAHCVG